MKLYIDTRETDRIKVGINGKIYEKDSTEKKAQLLLPFIIDLLKKKKKSVNDISQITVETGPGSFTGLRVGVSVAQALGYSLKVPVNKKNIHKGEVIEIKYS